MFIVTVDVDKCKACGDCIDACPNELMAMVEDGGKKHAIFSGDPSDCIGCYSCESSCEEGAVSIQEL